MSKISKILLLVVAFFSMFLLVACDKDDEISISVSAIQTTLVEGETTTVTATVTPAIPDGLTVELASSDEAVVTVTQAGVITAVGVGTATVTATVGEFSANVTFTVTAAVVPVTGVTLSAEETTLEIAETTQATAVVAPENATDKTVTFTSSDDSIATVNATGLITAVAAGSATITATAGTQTATVTITVNAAVVAVTSVEITIPNEKLAVGDTTQAVATVLPANATTQTVTYTTSAAAIATVSATGLVTAVAPGTAIITATSGTKTDTVVVTVFAAANNIQFALDAEVNDLVRIRGIVGAVIGRTVYLEDAEAGISVYNVPVDDLPNFVIGNEVIVDAKRGAYSGVRQLTTLTNFDVLSTGNPIRSSVEVEDLEQDTLIAQEYLRVSGTFSVVAVPSTIAVDENGSLTSNLTFRLTDGTNETVFYMHRSTNAVAVATMLDVIQAVEIGGMLTFDNVVITYYNSVAQLYVVESTTLSHVAPADPTMVVIQGDAQGDVGTTIQLIATAIPVGKQVTFTWTTSDDTIATVSANGLVTILKGGEFSISVAIVGYDITASKVMVGVVPLPDDVIIQAPAQFVVGETYQLTATVEPEAAIQEIIWESANNDIATIDANGLLTAVAPGAVKITAKAAADEIVYSEINIVVEAFIEPKIEIDGPSAIELGATIQFSATVFSNYVGQGVVWTSSAPTIISVDEDGLVVALLAGEAVITATSVDDDTLVATITVQVVSVTHSNILISADLADSEISVVVHEGDTFYVGLNAFPDFKNLENALQDGSVVYVLEGTYPADRFTISKSNVTILGPNAGINPVTNMQDRLAEAVLQARISFGAGVENTIIDGLKLINSGTLYSSVPVKNLIVRNLYFIDSSADAGQGVIFFGLVSPDLINENILITQNVMNDSRFLGYRGIRINNGKDLSITDNYFFKFYDAIRLEGSVNSGWTTPGTGAGAAGTAIIDGNIFEDGFQYSIVIGRYSATHIQITNNSIDAYAEGNGSFGHINLLNPQYSDTKIVVDIMYNTFESPTNWHNVRIQRYFELTDEQIDFNVNWNKFMYESIVDEDEVQLGYIHKGSDAVSAGNIINGANNYYAMTSLPAAAFFGTSTYEPYFLVLADFETALAAHLGIVLDDLAITSSVNEAMVDYTIQLTANKAATWSSGNEAVATISEAGVVTGISAGTVTITATFLEETVTIVITVIDRPNPTFFELVGGSSIAIGNTLQLTIDNATALPEKAYLGVLWSSSNEAIATVDENGLVTSVGSGTVTITATSTRDAGVNATHVIVVEDIVYTTENIIIDPTLETTNKYTLVTYDSINYYVGLNAFASLKDAEDVIANGSTVHLLAGTYSEAFVVKASNVTFVGPNAGVNPITNILDREAEANITARISFAEGIENVLFDGLMFTGVGQIYTNTPVKGITVQNVYFNAGTLSEAVQAFIFFGMATDALVNENILIQNNLFFDNKDVGRAVRLNNTKDLSILNNKFVGFFDPIRLEGTNSTGWTTPGSGVGAAGHLVIDGNRFEGTLQYPILIGRYSATHIEIINNSMNVNSGRNGVYGLMNILNAVYTDTKIVVDIKYNVFENSANWHNVRIQRYFALTEEQIEFNVNWNKFMFAPIVDGATTYGYVHKGSDAISATNLINAANNFYNTEALPAAAFFGTSTYATHFHNEADIDYALGAHRGNIASPVLQVTSTVNEVMLDFTIQLTANLFATWASLDANIATVSAAGVVTGIAPGTVKITATYLTQVVEVDITVNPRPAPTFMEIVGPTNALTLDEVQLSINVDTLTPALANKEVTWSSSDELVATIDALGNVTILTAGIVTFTATSVADINVTATLIMTIVELVYDPQHILVDPSLSTAALYDEVTFETDTFYVGLNAFTTITAAIAASSNDTVIVVRPGTYNESFTINNHTIMLVGPNFNVNPNNVVRSAEAILTGTITIGSGIQNTEINGFAFTTTALIRGLTPTVAINGFTFQYNHVYATSDPAAAWQEGPGYLNGFMLFNGANNMFKNFDISFNHFHGVKDVNININGMENLNIVENVFNNFQRDAIRFDQSRALFGDINIIGNVFENDTLSGENGIYFRSYAGIATTEVGFAKIHSNTFKNIGNISRIVQSGAISARNYQERTFTFEILFNVFEGNANNIHIRNNGLTTNHANYPWNAIVNYNVFSGIPTTYMYKNRTGSDTTTSNPTKINFDLNLYLDNLGNPITDFAPYTAWFAEVLSNANPFTTLQDLVDATAVYKAYRALSETIDLAGVHKDSAEISTHGYGIEPKLFWVLQAEVDALDVEILAAQAVLGNAAATIAEMDAAALALTTAINTFVGQLKPAMVAMTIAQAKEVAVSDPIVIKGIITARFGNSAYIQDATGGFYIFNASAYSGLFVVGNEIVIGGSRAVFNGLMQLSSANMAHVLNTEQTLPTAVVLDSLFGGDLTEHQSRIASLSGLTVKTLPILPISGTGGYNIVLTDGTNDIVLRIESETNLTKVVRDEINLIINDLLVGQGLDISSGIVSWFNGPQFVVTNATQLIAGLQTYELKASIVESEVVYFAENAEVVSDLTFAATGSFGSTIAWSSSNTDVISNTGVVTRPLDANATVTISYTITIGADSTYTGSINVVVIQAGVLSEQSIYSTGFEAAEGFTASSTYNNQVPALRGPVGEQWSFYYGTPSTTGPLNGLQSAQMRWYSTSEQGLNFGYVKSEFTFTDVTKVTFVASTSNNHKLEVSYSTDGGTTFIGAEEFVLTSSSQAFTYNVNVTGTIHLKFTLVQVGTSSGSRITLDDIEVFGNR